MQSYERVLIVDDDPHVAAVEQRLLSRLGFRVDLAGSVQEAVEKIDSVSFDLFVLDYMLPDGDGLALLQKIRAAGCQSPAIMVTSKAQQWDKEMAAIHGVLKYVTKPFEEDDFLIAVDEALGDC